MFLSDCDYCGEFTSVRWVFDRPQNEDRVACDDCREVRNLDNPRRVKGDTA